MGPQTGRLLSEQCLIIHGETVSAFEALLTTENAPNVKTVCFKYTAFLAKLFMKSKCYPDIIQFRGILPRLLQICGDECDASTRDECNLVDQLAGIATDSEAMLDESQTSSVFVLTTFQQTPLRLSFVHHKAQRALTKAFEAKTNAERLAILEPMRDLSGMPAELSGNIEMAATLCDDSEPHCLAGFIYDNRPQATKMAAH